MKLLFVSLAAFCLNHSGFCGEVQWALDKSEISYQVTHPLHVVHGKSASARGKGMREGNHWDFLVAVPVKTFDSGDNNRDLHMLEVTKAGLYPMIQVTARTGEIPTASKPATLTADLEIAFAGQKVKYPNVPLRVLDWTQEGAHIAAKISLSLKAYNIPPPSLLAMPVQDEVPITLDMFWKKVEKPAEK
jgi:hypothetical protein